jgi:uncharacterized protein
LDTTDIQGPIVCFALGLAGRYSHAMPPVAEMQTVAVAVTQSERVTAKLYPASGKSHSGASLILAHGAGGNQSSKFMVQMAQALAARGIDIITFNFLYSEAKRGLPDKNDKLEACYHGMITAFHSGLLIADAARRKLLIGGKSMGGRIATQVAATGAVDIDGIVLLGYPLHPPGRPDKLRSKHLPQIKAPMLFVQGSRDTFGTPEELAPILAPLKAHVDLYVVEGGDHSLKISKRAERSQADEDQAVLDQIEHWVRRLAT